MSIEEINKEVARKCLLMWNKENLDDLDEIVDPSIVYINPVFPKEYHGIEEFKKVLRGYQAVFPNSKIEILDEVAEHDRVVFYISASAIHQGKLGAIPPTGNKVKWTAMIKYRINDGKVVEQIDVEDFFSLLKQLDFVGDFLT